MSNCPEKVRLHRELALAEKETEAAGLAIQMAEDSTTAFLYSEEEMELENLRQQLAVAERKRDQILGARPTTSKTSRSDERRELHIKKRIVQLTRQIHQRFTTKLRKATGQARNDFEQALCRVLSLRAEIAQVDIAEIAHLEKVEQQRREVETKKAVEDRVREKRESIRQIAKERGITYLVHFTQSVNLPSILTRGIVPREVMNRETIDYEANDQLRIDGHLDCSCFSVMFPNYKMFYAYQQSIHRDKWCLISVNASLLWDADCLFCDQNAAHPQAIRAANRRGQTADALSAIFGDVHDHRIGAKQRALLDIPDYYPTNPQAEVLVAGVVPLRQFIAVIFPSENAKRAVTQITRIPTSIQVLVYPGFFGPRPDWVHWTLAI